MTPLCTQRIVSGLVRVECVTLAELHASLGNLYSSAEILYASRDRAVGVFTSFYQLIHISFTFAG